MRRYLSGIIMLLFVMISLMNASAMEDFSADSALQNEIKSKLDIGHPDVIRTAITIARDYPGDFSFNQVNAIYRYLVDNDGWSYFNDPSGVEYYKYANQSLKDGVQAETVGVGDCDDFAILMASLIESLGGSARIIFANDDVNGNSHAYPELYLGMADDQIIADINDDIENEWGEIPKIDFSEDGGAWMNLDYNASYPGGCLFGEWKTSRYEAWSSGNRMTPEIVPLIDPMDNLSNWKIIEAGQGSNASTSLVTGWKKGKAINFTYDLKENDWAEIEREVDLGTLPDLKGINLSCRITGRPIILGIILEEGSGANFSLFWTLSGDQTNWVHLDGRFSDFRKMGQKDADSTKQQLNQSDIKKLKIFVYYTPANDEISGKGSITIDQIRGVMRIPPGSIWSKVEEEKRVPLARQLAAESERIRQQEDADLQLSVLLAKEAMRIYPCIEADQAMRHGLEILPKQLMNVTHNDGILKVLFSPDGNMIATAGRDGTARIWRINDSRLLANITHTSRVIDIAFSTDGSKLATASVGNYSVLWDVARGREVKKINQRGTRDVTFSSDGTKLATACSDRTLRLWDANTGQLLNERNSSSSSKVVFSPNESILAAVDDDGSDVNLWDTDSYSLLIPMVHNSTVEDIVFSQDGIKLAIAEYKTVWIRDTRTGEALLKLNHDDHVDAIAFSPDGESLATVRNNVVRVWSLPCGREVLRLKHKDRVNDIEFSPDGTKLATCGWDEDKGIARVWNVFSGKEISRISHDRGVESISFSPKGDRLATASLDNTSAIWDFKSSLDLTNLSHTNNTKDYAEEDRVSDVAFSPDGSRVVTASWDTTARIWNATTGREIDRIDVDHTPSSSYWFPDPRIDSLSFSPDGMLLVIGYKGTIRIMDGNTTEILKIKDVGDITNIAFGSDRSKMATVSWGNKAELWNTSTGEMLIRVPLQELPEDKCYFECYDCYDIALSPDDKLIAIGTKEPSPYVISKGIAMILDANTGKILDNITVAEERVSKVAFSPDGARLATGSWDGTVKIWDLSTKREISRMVHGGSIFDLEFGINGTVLATSSGDCTARVWDADTGRELSCVLHEDPVYGISFSPDGSRLATASGSIAKIWQWRPEDLISCACSRLTRNLTINEWSHYLGNEPYMIDEYFSEANRLS